MIIITVINHSHPTSSQYSPTISSYIDDHDEKNQLKFHSRNNIMPRNRRLLNVDDVVCACDDCECGCRCTGGFRP